MASRNSDLSSRFISTPPATIGGYYSRRTARPQRVCRRANGDGGVSRARSRLHSARAIVAVNMRYGLKITAGLLNGYMTGGITGRQAIAVNTLAGPAEAPKNVFSLSAYLSLAYKATRT